MKLWVVCLTIIFISTLVTKAEENILEGNIISQKSKSCSLDHPKEPLKIQISSQNKPGQIFLLNKESETFKTENDSNKNQLDQMTSPSGQYNLNGQRESENKSQKNFEQEKMKKECKKLKNNKTDLNEETKEQELKQSNGFREIQSSILNIGDDISKGFLDAFKVDENYEESSQTMSTENQVEVSKSRDNQTKKGFLSRHLQTAVDTIFSVDSQYSPDQPLILQNKFSLSQLIEDSKSLMSISQNNSNNISSALSGTAEALSSSISEGIDHLLNPSAVAEDIKQIGKETLYSPNQITKQSKSTIDSIVNVSGDAFEQIEDAKNQISSFVEVSLKLNNKRKKQNAQSLSTNPCKGSNQIKRATFIHNLTCPCSDPDKIKGEKPGNSSFYKSFCTCSGSNQGS